MKINFLLIALCLSLSPTLLFAEDSTSASTSESVLTDSTQLADEFNKPLKSSISAEEYYEEQANKMETLGSQLEEAHQTGQISDADYEESKKSLEETKEFLETHGKNLGPEMAKAQEMAKPIMDAHLACKDLESEREAYQACLQSKLIPTEPTEG